MRSIFDWIRPENYRDVGRLREFWKRAVTAGICQPGELGFHNLVCAAIEAYRAKDPAKLFGWIVGGKRYDFISEACDEEARRLVRDWKAETGGRTPQRGAASRIERCLVTPDSWEIVPDEFRGG